MSVDQMIQSTPEIIPSKELKDQYADGRAATAFHSFEDPRRTQNYKDTLTGILRQHGCKKVLDAACGTGIDSIMLIEEGFKVVSIDASDQMLKHALKTRWDNRKDPKYDEWVGRCENTRKLVSSPFSEANKYVGHSENFATLKKIVLQWKCPLKIETTVTSVNGDASVFTLDYYTKENNDREFRLQYYAHKLEKFTKMLDEAFDNRAKHHVYADFKPMDQVPVPAFYIHVIEKAKKLLSIKNHY